MSIPVPVSKSLFARSGGVCALCSTSITFKAGDDVKVLGEQAHIYPQEKGGARWEDIAIDRIQPDFIDSHANLMALCPNCHTKIDKKPVTTYTVKYLMDKKKKHEEMVQRKFEQNTLDITIAELDVICKAIIAAKGHDGSYNSTDFSIIGIQDKIDKNNLSITIANDIELGLSQAKFVGKYLSDMNQIDILFAGNLVQSFKLLYADLNQLYSGDELYYEIMDKACPNHNNVSLRSATNVVVAYLFHECEIFEK